MKTLFITGGAGEIGAAIIEKFQAHDYEVITPTRKVLDLTDDEMIQTYIANYTTPTDVFIHCAGFNEPKLFSNIELQDLTKTLAINAYAFFKLIQGIDKKGLLKNKGSILGISSIYGSISRKGRFSYVASKHALIGMIKTLALEFAARGIKVNALSPGFVATKMTYQNNSADKIKELLKKVPLAKLAEPKDIANSAYFLCSEENAFITGQDIIADGGYTIGGFEE